MKTVLSILFIWSAGSCLPQSKGKFPTDNHLATRIDSIVADSSVEFMEKNSGMGLSIGLLISGVAYTYNYGTIEKDSTVLPTENTIYELASITKTFTATLLAKAVIEGKVNLKDDIRKYLEQRYPNLDYKGVPIRLQHLTSLTSGLPNWLPETPEVFENAAPDSIPAILSKIHSTYRRHDFFNDLRQIRLAEIPGTTAAHSNVAAQLQGYILEKVYGQPFSILLEKYFTDPLKMENTSVCACKITSPLLAKGHDMEGRLMPYADWEDIAVAGGIRSSISDMISYIGFQCGDDAAVQLSHQVLYKANGKKEVIAFNWRVEKNLENQTELSHSGGSLGFSS